MVPGQIVHCRLGAVWRCTVHQDEDPPVLVAQLVQVPDERGGVELFVDAEHLRPVVGDGPVPDDLLAAAGIGDIDRFSYWSPQLVPSECASFYEDEMAMLLAAQTIRGYLPRGGRETIRTAFFRKSVKVFGTLGTRPVSAYDIEMQLAFCLIPLYGRA